MMVKNNNCEESMMVTNENRRLDDIHAVNDEKWEMAA
jgi:hypothetical protein